MLYTTYVPIYFSIRMHVACVICTNKFTSSFQKRVYFFFLDRPNKMLVQNVHAAASMTIIIKIGKRSVCACYGCIEIAKENVRKGNDTIFFVDFICV